MRIDWVVAVLVFIIFLSWSILYYTEFFTVNQGQPIDVVRDQIANKIMDYVEVDFYTVPIQVDVENITLSAAVYFDYFWPAGTKNSTKIYYGTTKLLCNTTGNRTYFLYNLPAGNTKFRMEFSEQNVSMNCTDTFDIVNETLAIPWTEEKTKKVSNSLITQMNSTSYSSFKSSLGINRDFNININISGSITSYGPLIPNDTSVYIAKKEGIIEENNNNVTFTISVW